jgi:hypothetical protein
VLRDTQQGASSPGFWSRLAGRLLPPNDLVERPRADAHDRAVYPSRPLQRRVIWLIGRPHGDDQPCRW